MQYNKQSSLHYGSAKFVEITAEQANVLKEENQRLDTEKILN